MAEQAPPGSALAEHRRMVAAQMARRRQAAWAAFDLLADGVDPVVSALDGAGRIVTPRRPVDAARWRAASPTAWRTVATEYTHS